jgi:hypothetical protein
MKRKIPLEVPVDVEEKRSRGMNGVHGLPEGDTMWTGSALLDQMKFQSNKICLH